VEIETFRTLLTDQGQTLLNEARGHAPGEELALVTRLRRTYPAELVSAAVGQARLRQRAAAKFGADAERMYFTPNGVEQATRTSVAQWRAQRFAGLGVRRLADLCSGVGGDAIALARAGISVLAVDRDPLTCAVAEANAAALGLSGLIEQRCGDVAEVPLDGFDAVFVDPARRGGRGGSARSASGGGGGRATSGRIFDPEAYSPPLSWAVGAARRVPFAALKVAPGIPHQAVPQDAEAEWVSDSGDVKEAVLWFGTAAAEPHRATLLPAAVTLTGGRLPDPAPGPVRRYLYEPDGAVIRAHLVAEVAGQLDATLIDPTIAYLTAGELRPTPYATAYEITDTLPFGLKKLKALLRERGVGTVVIKKRGSAVEPEELRRKLRPEGVNSCTVFLTRVAGAPTMLLGQPVRA